ncbi:unnamed protein product [Calicophoron daubneyi]|uniref:Uncharacterized protein n=1 Tax=Calicophoron daubneyi TaxID=300641 RepID=A0AAV2TSV4_CALDB
MLCEIHLADNIFRKLLHCKPPTEPQWNKIREKALEQMLEILERIQQSPESNAAANNITPEQTLPSFGSCLCEKTKRVDEKRSTIENTMTKLNREFDEIQTLSLQLIRNRTKNMSYVQEFVRNGLLEWPSHKNQQNALANGAEGEMFMTDWTNVWKKRCRDARRPKISDKKLRSLGGKNEKLAVEFLTNCRAGRIAEVKAQITQNLTAVNQRISLNVNVADRHGCFGLLWALLSWDEKLVSLLLDFGADVNQVTDDGLSLLSVSLLYYYRVLDLLSSGKTLPAYVLQLKSTCQLEGKQTPESNHYSEEISRKNYIYQAEAVMFLPTSIPNSENKSMEKARLSQMRRLYTMNSLKVPITITRSTDKSNGEPEDPTQQLAEMANVHTPSLPSFQRFTDCLKRQIEQLQLSSKPNSGKSECDTRRPTPSKCSAGKSTKKIEVVKKESGDQERMVPASRRSLKEYPHNAPSLAAFDNTAEELSRSPFYLSTRSISPANLDTEKHKTEATESDHGSLDRRAVLMTQRNQILSMVDLLLRRGANPNVANQPLPCIFLTVQYCDVWMVQRLLKYGANPNTVLRVRSGSRLEKNPKPKLNKKADRDPLYDDGLLLGRYLLCRSSGGELLGYCHPAYQYQFVLNRYLRADQKGRTFLSIYDRHGNYSLI